MVANPDYSGTSAQEDFEPAEYGDVVAPPDTQEAEEEEQVDYDDVQVRPEPEEETTYNEAQTVVETQSDGKTAIALYDYQAGKMVGIKFSFCIIFKLRVFMLTKQKKIYIMF